MPENSNLQPLQFSYWAGHANIEDLESGQLESLTRRNQGSIDYHKQHIAEHGTTHSPMQVSYENGRMRVGDGNHRLIAAQESGLPAAPVHVVSADGKPPKLRDAKPISRDKMFGWG